MFLITCPWCGPRAESEFSCGGEAHIARPLDTDALTDAQWGDYLFMRKNTKGQHHEQWLHSSGCRRWFNAERNTVSYQLSYQFARFYKPGEGPDGHASGLAGAGSAMDGGGSSSGGIA
jgi:sarcosine oxidase subunit delta